jgi:ketosteroid isomerase-like protein
LKSLPTFLIVVFLQFCFFTVNAQTMINQSIENRLRAIEDRIVIKAVVDEFSNLADTKELDKQVMLFTEDGIVETISKGQPPIVLKGREQMKQAFSGFLSNFHTVYHQNGQQTIQVDDEKAEAVSYCRVILIGKQAEKETKTTLYVIYKDSFVKIDGKWLIKHRISNFIYREADGINKITN